MMYKVQGTKFKSSEKYSFMYIFIKRTIAR